MTKPVAGVCYDVVTTETQIDGIKESGYAFSAPLFGICVSVVSHANSQKEAHFLCP